MCEHLLPVRYHPDTVRMDRLIGPGPYFQCACHLGEFIVLHYMVSPHSKDYDVRIKFYSPVLEP